MKTQKQVQSDYTKGMLLYCVLYAIALIASLLIVKNYNPSQTLKIILALLTSLPIGGTILVFLQYIKNVDEFIRAKTTETFIKATGITLFFATFWGFMENYSAVKHLDFYMVYPIFWACFGLVQGFAKVGENAANS